MLKKVLLLLLLCVAAPLLAQAAEAPDITKACSVHTASGKRRLTEIHDHNYRTHLEIRIGGIILIEHPQELGGLYVQFYDRASSCRVDVEQNGEWVEAGTVGSHLTDWVPLPAGARKARLVNVSGARMFLAELSVYGPGDQPAQAASWLDADKADVLLMVCHCDDELLWFGGLLPTYAGERGLCVQVAVTVPSMPYRRLELLDGLWHCGVKYYPVFLGFQDAHGYSLKKQYSYWKKSKLQSRITATIRRFRPEVVVTHDLNGEYGHGGHKAVADTTVTCVKVAANPEKYPDSVQEYGVWQVKKLYVHLYGENQIRLNWHEPLGAFGGRDGLRVATDALSFHKSQTSHGWEMEDGGRMDNSVFGLYMTQVGPDEAGDDLMEHIVFSDDGYGSPAQITQEWIVLDDDDAEF